MFAHFCGISNISLEWKWILCPCLSVSFVTWRIWQWLSGVPAASRALCRSWDRVPSQLGVLRNQPLDFKFSQNSRVKSKEQRNAWAALGGRCPLVCNLREISLSPGQAQKNRELPLYLALPIPTLCGCGKGTQVSVSNASSAALLSSMVASHQQQVSI